MKKGICITGLNRIKVAQESAGLFHEENVLWVKEFDPNDHFRFLDAHERTELIVIECWQPIRNLYPFRPLLEGVVVHKQGLDPYIIHPKIMIVAPDIDHIDNHLVLFEFINTTPEGYSHLLESTDENAQIWAIFMAAALPTNLHVAAAATRADEALAEYQKRFSHTLS